MCGIVELVRVAFTGVEGLLGCRVRMSGPGHRVLARGVRCMIQDAGYREACRV